MESSKTTYRVFHCGGATGERQYLTGTDGTPVEWDSKEAAWHSIRCLYSTRGSWGTTAPAVVCRATDGEVFIAKYLPPRGMTEEPVPHNWKSREWFSAWSPEQRNGQWRFVD
jgi:hypothetical protein